MPDGEPATRCLASLRVTPDAPEYLRVSYEKELRVRTPEPPPLPIPPYEMRVLVGPTDPADFDNADGALVVPGVGVEQYEAVFDWGCGCGRVARKLMQQDPRPSRYLGIDLHRGMVEWCRTNLAPHDVRFEFLHHDVYEKGFNPDATDTWLPFPAPENTFTLALAWSVFTHVNEEQAVRYLHEMRRILRDDGVLYSTWFLFDKSDYPMMDTFQNALFINDINPTNAVIFDREWLRRTVARGRLHDVRRRATDPARLSVVAVAHAHGGRSSRRRAARRHRAGRTPRTEAGSGQPPRNRVVVAPPRVAGSTRTTAPASSVTYRPFERSTSTSTLPNGSATTATRPTGISDGSTRTAPPLSRNGAIASSTESTNQLGSYRCSVVSTTSVSVSRTPRPA